MTTQTFHVTGLTCHHCARAVQQEVLAAAPDVREVDVDLASGAVTVTAERTIDAATLGRAVEEAGYALR